MRIVFFPALRIAGSLALLSRPPKFQDILLFLEIRVIHLDMNSAFLFRGPLRRFA